ncbi:MAG: thioredoxin [Candidatus Levybacteria bacterium]|nr:thioredoxin [Candidatus Levybacteria bacterium]
MADVTFTDSNFKTEVLETKGSVVVDFWAPWCGPCRTVSPIIDELAKEFKGKVRIGKINVDENSQIAGEYGVMSIPSVVFFKNGQPIRTMVGAQSKENYKQEIEQLLGS